jgi:two-component system osmolarity sensor histidine kinase EnvZ
MSLSLSNDIIMAYNLQKQNIDTSILNINIKNAAYKYNQKAIDHSPNETIFLYELLKAHFKSPINIEFIAKDDFIKIEVFSKNSIISFITPSKRINNPTTYIFILWMTGTSLIFLLLSIIFTRNQIRPIIKLARAADRFGKGQKNLHLKPEGAAEIRKASMAFIKMKERIERQISYRTEMLAGVSHDLRTPLTRMKLQLAMTQDSELLQMANDINDMEYMINSYIDFARGDIKENTKLIYFNDLLNQVFAPYKNKDFSIINKVDFKVALKINALKRCFQNLLDNAFKYGNKVILNCYATQSELYIELHDNGPGIPSNQREEVFKPFFRLDQSRNKDTGGAGLGLAVTRDIINNHGGQIYLNSSEILDGLKAVIILPL